MRLKEGGRRTHSKNYIYIARLLAACNLPRVCVYNSDYVLSATRYAKMSDTPCVMCYMLCNNVQWVMRDVLSAVCYVKLIVSCLCMKKFTRLPHQSRFPSQGCCEGDRNCILYLRCIRELSFLFNEGERF